MNLYRVNYYSLDDTWCRYFKSHKHAVRFMSHKVANGYTAELIRVPEL